jgi:hypothetical protein
MNNLEAMLVLQAYRLGGQDASDPQFSEALKQARTDPELAAWFEEERAIDTRIQTRIKAAAVVPPDLKSKLLALRSVVRPTPWWRRPGWLAAACFAVLVGIAALVTMRSTPRFADFRQAMLKHHLQKDEHFSFMTNDIASIRQWLSERNMPANFDLPAQLRDMIEGCKIVDWNGEKVTLLCTMYGKDHVDVFVIDRSRFRELKPSAAPRYTRSDGLTTAVWRRGGRTYLLASSVDEQQLRRIF